MATIIISEVNLAKDYVALKINSDAAIKSLGISEKDAHVVVHAFKSKKFKDKDLSLAPHLDKLPKLVDSFNKLLVKNIRKEIECYHSIQRRT